MALKRRSRLRVRVELPLALQGDKLIMDKLRNQLYKAVSDSLSGLDSEIDIEIENEENLEENFREGWADVMEGRTMSWEEMERRLSEDAD